MRVLNVMWSFGSAYASIHKVHSQVLALLPEDAVVENWVLQGVPDEPGEQSCYAWQWPKWRVKPSKLKRLLQFSSHAQLRKKLDAFNPDLLLLDGIGTARLILPLLKARPTLQARVVFHGMTRLRDADIRLFHRFKEQLELVAVSKGLANQLESMIALTVFGVTTAFDPAIKQQRLFERDEARVKLGLPQLDSPVLAVISRLVPAKNIEIVIKAAELLKQRNVSFQLVIAGDGILFKDFEESIDKLGLRDYVFLMGHVNGVDALARAFDMILIPSLKEGQGLVLQEAALAGVPVLVSDIPVFREQLGEIGPYLPVKDANAWADRIEVIMHADDFQRVAVEQSNHLALTSVWQAFCEEWNKLLLVR